MALLLCLYAGRMPSDASVFTEPDAGAPPPPSNEVAVAEPNSSSSDTNGTPVNRWDELLRVLGQWRADAPEWDSCEVFLEKVRSLALTRLAEREIPQRDVRAALEKLQFDLGAALAFLGIDLGSIRPEDATSTTAAAVLEALELLRGKLGRVETLRHPARSIAEERTRIDELNRADSEAVIAFESARAALHPPAPAAEVPETEEPTAIAPSPVSDPPPEELKTVEEGERPGTSEEPTADGGRALNGEPIEVADPPEGTDEIAQPLPPPSSGAASTPIIDLEVAAPGGAAPVSEMPAPPPRASPPVDPGVEQEVPTELAEGLRDWATYRDNRWVTPGGACESAPWLAPSFGTRLARAQVCEVEAGSLSRLWILASAVEKLGGDSLIPARDIEAASAILASPGSLTAGVSRDRLEMLRTQASDANTAGRFRLFLEAIRPWKVAPLSSPEIERATAAVGFQSGPLRSVVAGLLEVARRGVEPVPALRDALSARVITAQEVAGRLVAARDALHEQEKKSWNAGAFRVETTHCQKAWSMFMAEFAKLFKRLGPPGRGGETSWSTPAVAAEIEQILPRYEEIANHQGARFKDRAKMDRAAQALADAASYVNWCASQAWQADRRSDPLKGILPRRPGSRAPRPEGKAASTGRGAVPTNPSLSTRRESRWTGPPQALGPRPR